MNKDSLLLPEDEAEETEPTQQAVLKESAPQAEPDGISGSVGGIIQFLGGLHPSKIALLGYLSYVVIGWLVLCLPMVQASKPISALDNLFTATSAVSTTGLVTLSISDNYNFAGQLIVLVLFQLGGLGYMTFGSFVVLSRKTPLSAARQEVGRTVFSLPESFRIDKFIRSVITFAFLIELLGVLALYPIFRDAGDPNPIWSAIFHSVSAFCTAGFSLNNSSFEAYSGNFWLNAVIGGLSYMGAIGFIVFVDYWRMLRGKIKSVTLTSKIIIWSSLWLMLAGTILLFVSEPSVQNLPTEERLMASFFQSMTAMTTVGFNTIGISGISRAALLVIIVLMIIGASPSGTGGGLKTTTFSAMIGVVRSALRGEHQVRFWGRAVPLERVWLAIAGLGLYLFLLISGIYLLELTETLEFEQLFFEAASALGTVGLSMGITSQLSAIGKIIIIFLMFCGRLGPLTFGIALFTRPVNETGHDNDLAI